MENKYQIRANVLVAADGFVVAKNKEEAKKKWREFCFSEMCGVSVSEVYFIDVLTTKNRHFDKEFQPTDEEFENKDCITHNYLN